MSQSLRSSLISSTGLTFHAFNRGVDHHRLFLAECDYDVFLDRIAMAVSRGGLTLLAYCLMPNHFHFLITQHTPYAISKFMKEITFAHSLRTNRLLRRKGHLVQGRYKFKSIDNQFSLVLLSRYVHLNPVYAGLVPSADLWKHSSCLEYLHQRKCKFVDAEPVLSEVGGPLAYTRLLDPTHDDPRDDLFRLKFD